MLCPCTQLDMITDVFNRLVSSCHAKCIATRYAEPDLNKGESVCIDRCVRGAGLAMGGRRRSTRAQRSSGRALDGGCEGQSGAKAQWSRAAAGV